MENFLLPRFGWMDLLFAALILYGAYALLYLLRDRLDKSRRPDGIRARAFHALAAGLLLYEPLVVLILVMIFVFINPAVHGLIALLVIVAGFSRIRDYLSGRIVLFTPLIAVGKRMKTERHTGVISRIDRIGLYLQTGEGLHFINYTDLLTHGYSLVTGKDIGGYYQLSLTPPPERENALQELADRLTTTPYLDRSFRPELSYAEYGRDRIQARLSVREEKHLTELLALLQEWGYPATIAKR